MSKYNIRDEQCSIIVDAASDQAAEDAAIEWCKDGEWGAPATYLVPMTTGFSDTKDDDDSGDDSESWKHLPPPSPTRARPGTPEKLAILAERYEAGRDLWHDDDVTVFPKNLYRVEM